MKKKDIDKNPNTNDSFDVRHKPVKFNSTSAIKVSDSVLRMKINCEQFDWLFLRTNSQLNLKFIIKHLKQTTAGSDKKKLVSSVYKVSIQTTDEAIDTQIEDIVLASTYESFNHFSFILSRKHFELQSKIEDPENHFLLLSAILKDSEIKIVSTY